MYKGADMVMDRIRAHIVPLDLGRVPHSTRTHAGRWCVRQNTLLLLAFSLSAHTTHIEQIEI